MRPIGALVVAAVAIVLIGCRKAAGPTVASGPQAGQSWTNSLGMRFVPVPGLRVLVAVDETPAVDFEAFVKETKTPWVPPDAETGGEYPAANVTWDDAVAFCQWLTERERVAHPAGAVARYRLPTDVEWSLLAGVPKEEGDTPAARGEASGVRYTWGSTWPPPAGAGNFAGEEAEVDQTEPNNFIAGYRDGYAKLAPLGKFAPSSFGLHDVSGNVMEWCDDWFDARHLGRVARGGSWLNGDPDTLSLTHRAELAPRAGLNVVGFRCVLEVGP